MARTDTLALIERYYAAFNAGNRAGVLACLDDNIAHDINQGDRQTGKAAFTEFLAHMDRCYAEKLADSVICVAGDGTRAAAEFVVHGQYLCTDEGLLKVHGQTYVLPAGAFFSLDRGLITRVSVSCNLADWPRQMGG